MISRTFAELVRDMRSRRTVGDKPPVLLLGAGASVDAGIGAMNALFSFAGVKDFDAFTKYIATTDPAERYRYFAAFLQTQQPAEVTPGYRALATLCAQNYFDIVLTTNMDPLLDDALASAQLWRRDYLLIVNGVIRPDRLNLLLGGQSPRVKIVKLHGDLFQRFMAWTVPEMDDFLTQVMPMLTPAIAGRDVLVVGHSLRDERIRQLAQSTGGTLWFTHPEAVPDHLAGLADMRAVIAPESAFERLFTSLVAALQLETTSAHRPGSLPITVQLTALDSTVSGSEGALLAAAGPDTLRTLTSLPDSRPRRTRPAAGPSPQLSIGASPSAAEPARTLDDLLASVLSVTDSDGRPSSTAFLLAAPRVIVCDSFAVGPLLESGTLTLLGAHSQSFKARVLRSNRSHPFGPTLLEVPESLKVPGLLFNLEPLRPRDVVQVAVSAGDRTGISTGEVTSRVDTTVTIESMGPVEHLSSLDTFMLQGSSGAPVVDSAMSVRGFIVASNADEATPVSFMFPIEHWVAFLSGDEPREPMSKPIAAKKPKRRRRS